MENNNTNNYNKMMGLEIATVKNHVEQFLAYVGQNMVQSGIVDKICKMLSLNKAKFGGSVYAIVQIYLSTLALNAVNCHQELTPQFMVSFWNYHHLSDDDESLTALIGLNKFNLVPDKDLNTMAAFACLVRKSYEHIIDKVDKDFVEKVRDALYCIINSANNDDNDDGSKENETDLSHKNPNQEAPRPVIPERRVTRNAPPWERGEQRTEKVCTANVVGIPEREKTESLLLKIKPKQRLTDIAGLYDVKAELKNIINFLKNPEIYKKFGAEMPKGMLLYGPPGTGKTLIAKAVAGECGCNFIALTGGDFTASKWGENDVFVKNLFQLAQENSPCIIFIDEIDTIGMKRVGSGNANGIALSSFLNPLLTAMDGFKSGDGIFVIAATNRIDILDEALLRPGRFDYKLSVPFPTNEKERNEVIEMYLKGKQVKNLNLDYISRRVIGMSPAEIKNILNDAAISAIAKNMETECKDTPYITCEIFDTALLKHSLGGNLKEFSSDNPDDDRITAYHEAGHALAGLLLGKNVNLVTIRESTTGAAGITCFTPNSSCHFSKTDMQNDIMVAYAGRAAEELVFGDANITGGASRDIHEATKLLKEMTMRLGMEGYGLLDYTELGGSDNVQFDGIQKCADALYNGVKCLLVDHRDVLDRIAEELLAKKTLNSAEIEAIGLEILGDSDAIAFPDIQ